MSAIRRRSTVHDLASLRIHPDGSRVQNIASANITVDTEEGLNHHQRTTVNLTSRTRTTAVRDTRGNWIARDAGGCATVKQKPTINNRKGKEHLDDEEELDLDGQLVEASQPSSEGEGNHEEFKDERANKRTKFLHDYTFLDGKPIVDAEEPRSWSTANTINLPAPSSVRFGPSTDCFV